MELQESICENYYRTLACQSTLYMQTPATVMKTYETVIEALNDLQKRGFTYDFNLEKGTYCFDSFLPSEFEIVETHRFEHMSDPDENAIVYAIESQKHAIKGVLVNSFGVYSNAIATKLAAQMKPDNHSRLP